MFKKLCFLFAFLPSLIIAQHTISGTFSPASDFNYVLLYKVTPTTAMFVNNTEIDEKGQFSITLDSTATEGMYRIVYAAPQDDYNFDVIYNAKEDVELEFSLNDGVTYKASKENILLTSYHKSINLVSEKINQFYSQEDQDEKSFKTIFKILADTQSEFETASKGTISSEFIKASKPYIPNEFEDLITFSKNFKSGYFDHIDFGNKTLQNSNFLIETTLNYTFSFVDQTNENASFINNVDHIVKVIGNNSEIKKVLLEVLWHQFAEQENETVANYISNSYLLELAKSKNDRELTHSLTAFNAISIGEIAPDFSLEIENEDAAIENKNMRSLNIAKHYILVFWSSTCSHCLEELPLLNTYLSNSKEGNIQTIAIGLEDDLYSWKEKTYELDTFIHVFGEGKWENKIGNTYNVSATPTYFILNEAKEIIAKPYDFKTLKSFFDSISLKN